MSKTLKPKLIYVCLAGKAYTADVKVIALLVNPVIVTGFSFATALLQLKLHLLDLVPSLLRGGHPAPRLRRRIYRLWIRQTWRQ